VNQASKMHRGSICIVSTVPFVLRWFMAPHILLLSQEYDITLVTSGSEKDLSVLLNKHVTFHHLEIERKISLKNDLITLFKLWNYFRKEKFDCVHSIMPKSGVLAMVASRLAKVPFRLHTFTGQVWSTKRGVVGLLLKLLDRLLVINSTEVLADSHSQKIFLIENGIVDEKKITVFADGSFAGVDENRFQYSLSARAGIRTKYAIPEDAIVFLFLGRLNKDKGILNLIQAFSIAAKRNPDIYLLVVGPDEENLEMQFSLLEKNFPGRVLRVGFTDRPENYLSASDALCLPSYREGFPNVPLQAASTGLPTIASRIYGVVDAVKDGVTGILHTPGSDNEISDAILLLAADDELRKSMGKSARARVLKKFTESRITTEFYNHYVAMFSILEEMSDT
jgi:glycosyltransferase involved in cell wall biosynthesis